MLFPKAAYRGEKEFSENRRYLCMTGTGCRLQREGAAAFPEKQISTIYSFHV